MIRRIAKVKDASSGPSKKPGNGKNIGSSTNGKSFERNMDRSIHSIEEEGSQMEHIDGSPISKSLRFQPNDDDDMDDSTHSGSSLGNQSNFIQQRINKHKKEGIWVESAMIQSDSSDDDNQVQDDIKNTDGDDAAVKVDVEEEPGIPRAPSLVSLLKMEPINEEKVLKNKMNFDNDGSSIVSPERDSVKSDVSGISDEVGYIIDDDIDSQEQMKANNSEEDGRRSSFIPNVGTDQATPMDDSDTTFLFTSIHSPDNMTHASDAPDYDYGDNRDKQNIIVDNSKDKILATDESQGQKMIPPMMRNSLEAKNNAMDEVCQVLGLPKDTPRKVHRGIMSRQTEERLRNMIDDESESTASEHTDARSKRNGDADSKSTLKEGRVSSPVFSDDSSIDLVFGDSPRNKSEGSDKWERVRNDRRMQRESLILSSATASNEAESMDTNGTSVNVQVDDNDTIEETSWHNSWHNSHNWIKNPLVNVKCDDGDGISLVGKIYNHFQPRGGSLAQPASDCDSSDGSCSNSSSEEEEDSTWDMNILTEGQYYLSMSMLVYVYGLLRQTSLLGHTQISFDEVDVNSSQAESRIVKSYHYLNNTKSAGFIIRVVMDELEKKGAFSDVEAEGDICVLQEFKRWVHDSRRNQLDAATVDTIRELRRKLARKRWKRAIFAVRLAVRLGKGNKKVDMKLVAQQSFRRPRGGSMEELKENLVAKESRRSRPLASSMIWLHDQRSKIIEGLRLSEEKETTLVDQSDITEIVNDAFEQPRFFKEGSLMSNLIESSIEVVWFSDRHPNDVVYAICCNRRQKRVSVVFRGTVNSHNWLMNLKFFMTTHPNPISENYPGRVETLGFHTGYLLYMTRQRKDDSLTKLEEIFSKIDIIGRELAPDGDYNLSITGHSLGGALATLLSFFVATNRTFSNVKTIRVFTFAAPRVGCYGFARAYQHLERNGKIRLARFSNTCDVVPLIPFHSLDSLWRSYQHVGMHIRLLGYHRLSQYWLRRALDVTYPKDDWWATLKRSFWASLVVNMNSPAGYKENHTLSDHQKRIRFTLEFRNALAQTDFLHDKRRVRLKTLDEYYFIRGATGLTGTRELTKIAIEKSAKLADRRRLQKFVLVLLIIAIAEALLLLRFLNVSMQCENLPWILYPLYPLIGCQYQHVDSKRIETTCHFEEDTARSAQINAVEKSLELHESDEQILVRYKEKSHYQSFFRLPRFFSFQRDEVISPTLLLESPCFWGYCIISPKSRLPWGVRLEHLPIPSEFEYKFSQDLELVSEQFLAEVHTYVSENTDIQSNISSTVLNTLKTAENKLLAVEHNDEPRIDSIFSIGLKQVVRLIIGYLESLIL